MTQVTDIDVALLARAYEATGRVLAAIPDERWDAPSPCAEWTVREVADHLVDALDFFASTVSGTTPGAPTDYDDATRRCMAAFARPEVLAADGVGRWVKKTMDRLFLAGGISSGAYFLDRDGRLLDGN